MARGQSWRRPIFREEAAFSTCLSKSKFSSPEVTFFGRNKHTHWFENRETTHFSLSTIGEISDVSPLTALQLVDGEISSVFHTYIPCIVIGDVSSMGIK